MKILLERAETEIEIKKSRFISIAIPCTSLQMVKELVVETRHQHPNATHVVHAAVVGENGTEFSYSDDHEPKNTAGRPAIEVLKGSGITNIAVMIIRYFGGTLLGTGGLVKAYGDSVKEVLQIVKTEELIEKSSFMLTTTYDMYDQMKIILNRCRCTLSKEEFTTDILFEGQLPTTYENELQSAVVELTNGRDEVLFY